MTRNGMAGASTVSKLEKGLVVLRDKAGTMTVSEFHEKIDNLLAIVQSNATIVRKRRTPKFSVVLPL